MVEDFVAMLSGHALGAAAGAMFVGLILCGLGLPVPEDVVLVTGGVLTWLTSPLEPLTLVGMLTHPQTLIMVFTGLLGILAGDSIIFFAGRRFGGQISQSRWLRRIVKPAKQKRVEHLLRQRGNVVVMIARFLPGLRAPTYFTVGHARVRYTTFLFFDGLAALVSAPLWVFLGFWFGDDIRKAATTASRFSYILAGAAAAIVVVWLVVRYWRKRRLTQDPPDADSGNEH